MSTAGQWVIGFRPFAKPSAGYTAYQLQHIGGSLKPAFIQDERTGDDAIFSTKQDAQVAIKSITKNFPRLPK